MNKYFNIKYWFLLFALLSSFLFGSTAYAEIHLRDLAGREVVLKKPVKRIVLGEGRFLSILGVLGVEQPLDYVVGMMNDFRLYDPSGFAQYKKKIPNIDNVAIFGNTNELSVSIEKIILLRPELAIFGLDGHGPGAKSSHIIKRLEEAGIQILFVDFRQDPIANTAKSVKLVSQALGIDAKGDAFAHFYNAEIEKITSRVKTIKPEERPSVLFELRASTSQECCLSVSEGMFASMANFAGGTSYAENLLTVPVGNLSHEYILSKPFDIYIGTAIGSSFSDKPGQKMGVSVKQPADALLVAGPEISAERASAALDYHLKTRRFDQMRAVKEGKAYMLWHHFYNSPLNLYAVQKMATWFHPRLFSDIDPEKTLETLFSGFHPVDLKGTYSVALSREQ